MKKKANTSNTPKRGYSISETAESIGVSERFLRRQCYLGKLEHCRIGRRIVVTPEQLQKFLTNHSVVA